MITLKDLAAILQEQIADEMEGAPLTLTFPLGDGPYARTERYVFDISTDTADYKPPVREGNTVTKYIQGVLLESGSEIEQTSTGSFNGAFSAQLEVLCPVTDYDVADAYGALVNERLVDTVRQILTNVFVKNSVTEQTDADGFKYTVGTLYSMVNSGMRQIVPQVGDSFTFSVNLTFFVIQNGISSKSIKIIVEEDEVDYITLGIRRDSVTDQNVASNTADGATTANVDSSALVIQLTAPATKNPPGGPVSFSQRVMWATLDGIKSSQIVSVTIQYPGDLTKTLPMYITSACINAQGTKNASIEATLTQAMNLEQ
jgi:hypothetical protein